MGFFLAMCAGHMSIFFILIFGLSSFTVSKVMGQPITSVGSFRDAIFEESVSKKRNFLSVVALQGKTTGSFVSGISLIMSTILILNFVSLRTSFCFWAFWIWSASFAGWGGIMSIIPIVVFWGSNSASPMCSYFDLKTMLRVFFFKFFIVVLMTSVFCVGSMLGQSTVSVSCSSLNRIALDIVFIRPLPMVFISYTEFPVGDCISVYLVVWNIFLPFKVFASSFCLTFIMFTCCGWTTLGMLYHLQRSFWGTMSQPVHFRHMVLNRVTSRPVSLRISLCFTACEISLSAEGREALLFRASCSWASMSGFMFRGLRDAITPQSAKTAAPWFTVSSFSPSPIMMFEQARLCPKIFPAYLTILRLFL